MSTPSLRTVLIIAEKREVLAAIRTLLLTIHRAEPYGPADILTPTTRYRLTAKGDGVRLMVGLRVDVVYHVGRVPLEMVNEARRRLVVPGGEARYGGLSALLTEFRGPPIRHADDPDPARASGEWRRIAASVAGWGPAVPMSDLEDAIRRARDAMLKSRTPPAAPPRLSGAPNLTMAEALDAVWGVDWGGATPRLGRFGHQRFVEFVRANDEPETCPDIESYCTEG